MTMHPVELVVAVAALAAAVGCAGVADTRPTGDGGRSVSSSSGSGGSGGAGGQPSGGGLQAGAGGAAGGVVSQGSCADPPPPGAVEAADPPPFSGGSCPTLPAATGTVELPTAHGPRQLILVLPADLDPTEQLPVIFLWHWLGGDAAGFVEQGDLQAATDEQRFIAVVPEQKGDLQFTWPYSVIDSQARFDEELELFDDMLACVSQQLNVNKNCVASAGVSAGALFTDQLVGRRSQYLSSFISLSGGVGGLLIKPWQPPARKLPALVLWGGPTDACMGVMQFAEGSARLEDALTTDGHFFVECIHNCGHVEPPLDPLPGHSAFAGLWQFAFDHPFWLSAGSSPYQTNGLPDTLPAWCGIGPGSASPRTGACPDPPQC